MSRIDNRDDAIDTRQVVDRIEELEGEYPPADDADDSQLFAPVDTWEADDRAEWERLTVLMAAVVEQVEESEARRGVTLIREPEWVDYVKAWYEDTWGHPWIKTDPRHGGPQWDQAKGRHVYVSWSDVMGTEPFGFINWDAAANDMRRDRAEIEWEGFTYIVG